MRTSAYNMILNKYEYFLKETVCSLLYQTNLINTWPYLHIYIKSYNTQYPMDYIYICTQRGFKYTNYGKWMPLQKILYYRILLIWFLIKKTTLCVLHMNNKCLCNYLKTFTSSNKEIFLKCDSEMLWGIN